MRRILPVFVFILVSVEPGPGREDRVVAPGGVSIECRIHRVREGAEEGLKRWLQGLPEEQRGDRLRQLEEHFTAAELELVAVPRMVVFPGSESGIEFTHEINCPVDCQGARIPQAWGDRIVPVERDPPDGLKMLPESPVLPPFPGKLQGKQVGLVVSAGIIERDGGPEVKFEIDHSALVGFLNRGKPVDLRPAQGEGKALRLIENCLLEPVVLEQKDSFTIGVEFPGRGSSRSRLGRHGAG